MSKERVQLSRNFTTIPNRILRDESISLEARGMLSLICSMSADWTFYRKEMMRLSGVGKGKYYKIINELKAAGILHIDDNRGDNGTFGGKIWSINLEPCTEKRDMDAPCTDLPCPDMTDVGEIETHKKNNLIKKNNLKEKSTKKDLDFVLLVNHFNSTAEAVGWRKCQKVDQTRKNNLKARVKDVGGADAWMNAITHASTCPHLIGQNNRGWTATFDWLLKSANFTKLMEGNYDKRTSTISTQGGNTSIAAIVAKRYAGT